MSIARHIDAALGEQPFLVGDVGRVSLDFGRSAIELWIGGTFHLVDGPSVFGLAKDIHRAVVAVVDERGFADVLHPIIHPLLCLCGHGFEVESPIWLLGVCLLVVAKEAHGQVAHLIACLKPCLGGIVDHFQLGSVGLQPQCLVA